MNSPMPPAYKDRKTGLIVFGFFTIVMGLINALFVPLMIFTQSMTPPAQQVPNAALSACVIYGPLAVLLITLGIGSMMARRWARALLLIFSWSWFLIGLFMLGAMAFLLPKMQATLPTNSGQPEISGAMFMVIPMVFIGFFFVILPGVWVLFYRSPHVKATCEALDPVERWTDRCPLPVLAMCLWLAFSVPMMAVMGVAYRGVLPAFGSFATGPAASSVYFLIAAVWAYCAWSLYRLETRGWWILLVTVVLFAISTFMTYSRHDIMELYQLMGYSDEMIAQMKKLSFMQGNQMAWMSSVGVIPFVAYLLFIRRYLRTT